jgi:hypothetical protein
MVKDGCLEYAGLNFAGLILKMHCCTVLFEVHSLKAGTVLSCLLIASKMSDLHGEAVQNVIVNDKHSFEMYGELGGGD